MNITTLSHPKLIEAEFDRFNRFEQAPDFYELNEKTVSEAVTVGAAVMRNVVSKEELHLIEDAYSERQIVTCDNLQVLHDLLALLRTTPDIRVASTTIHATAYSKAYGTDSFWKPSHNDHPIIEYGLSLLVPYSGPNAFFAGNARGAEFEMSSDMAPQDFFTSYGPGDAILLRQRLLGFDGQRAIDLPQVEHAAVARQARSLILVDVRTPTVEFKDAA